MTTKGNFPHLDVAKFILFIVVCAIFYGFLFSCSASYHLKKYEKKGGKIEHVTDTLTYYQKDSVLIQTKDTTYFQYYYTQKDTIVKQNVFLYPKTRFNQRLEIRRFKDSLKFELKKYTDSLRYAFKTHKINVKTDSKVKVSEQKTERKKNNRFTFPLIIVFLLIIIVLAFRFK
jgi:uncharacterized membrane protein